MTNQSSSGAVVMAEVIGDHTTLIHIDLRENNITLGTPLFHLLLPQQKLVFSFKLKVDPGRLKFSNFTELYPT